MKARVEIVASGFGGQGVVRLGQTLGEAAVKQGLHVTMLKSHGTEMRGGYVRSQVVLSPDIIDSPMCENPDYLVALSSSAYGRFKGTVPDHGLIIYDPAFVENVDRHNLSCTQRPLPAKDLAMKHFGRPIFANSIILGAMAKLVDALDKDKIMESLLELVPRYCEENREAFGIGFRFF